MICSSLNLLFLMSAILLMVGPLPLPWYGWEGQVSRAAVAGTRLRANARPLRLVGRSASTLRYQPRDDGNGRLRERLTELAGQHRRHGFTGCCGQPPADRRLGVNVKRTYRVLPRGRPDGAQAPAQEAAGTPSGKAWCSQ